MPWVWVPVVPEGIATGSGEQELCCRELKLFELKLPLQGLEPSPDFLHLLYSRNAGKEERKSPLEMFSMLLNIKTILQNGFVRASRHLNVAAESSLELP